MYAAGNDAAALKGLLGDVVAPCSSNEPGCEPRGGLVITLINDEDKNDKMAGNTVEIQKSATTAGGAKTDPSGHATFNDLPTGPYTFSQTNPCFANPSPLPTVTVKPNIITSAELHVSRIPSVIKIKQLTFTGSNLINKDTEPFGPPGSAEWVDGRPQKDQFPIAYSRNKKVSFNAVFTVVTAPLCAESVDVKGSATFGSASLEWTGTVTVNPGDGGKDIPALALNSNNPLPDEVGIFESSNITWQMSPGKRGFASAGVTRNVVYVTLGDPAGGVKNFWTLLDVSCRAAAGQKTEADVITKSFAAFTAGAHTKVSIIRKRDDKPLQYWLDSTTVGCGASTTFKLLEAANGAGQCGAWAEFMIDMCKVHGIISPDKILIERNTGRTEGFIIKAWVFDHPPASQASAFTHWQPSQARPGTRVPALGNKDSPNRFVNHFIVFALGKFWDPSYGNGPFADQKAWEKASIDGVFRDSLGGSPPPGTIRQIGFDKSLNPGTKLLIFTNLTTRSVIP